MINEFADILVKESYAAGPPLPGRFLHTGQPTLYTAVTFLADYKEVAADIKSNIVQSHKLKYLQFSMQNSKGNMNIFLGARKIPTCIFYAILPHAYIYIYTHTYTVCPLKSVVTPIISERQEL